MGHKRPCPFPSCSIDDGPLDMPGKLRDESLWQYRAARRVCHLISSNVSLRCEGRLTTRDSQGPSFHRRGKGLPFFGNEKHYNLGGFACAGILDIMYVPFRIEAPLAFLQHICFMSFWLKNHRDF